MRRGHCRHSEEGSRQVTAVLIREALLADAPALARLNTVAMGYDYPEDRTAEKLAVILADSRAKILVAELAGRVAGYLHLEDYEVLYVNSMKNIMGIAVAPDCRRMGIGRQLLAAGEAWAREQGAQAIRLVSGESRTDAHAFYRALGFAGNKMQLNLKKSL